MIRMKDRFSISERKLLVIVLCKIKRLKRLNFGLQFLTAPGLFPDFTLFGLLLLFGVMIKNRRAVLA